MSDAPAETTADGDESVWLAALEAHAREDRVVGAYEPVGCATKSVRRLRIVTTWHGHEALRGELPRLGELLLGAAAEVCRARDDGWEGLTADLRRADVGLIRIGDLLPCAEGVTARVLFDPGGLLDQWVRWSRGRTVAKDPDAAAARRAERLLEADGWARSFADLVPGARIAAPGGPLAVRPELARSLRVARERLRTPEGETEAALAARLDDLLRPMPGEGAGRRVVPEDGREDEAYEAFLRVADDEGFRGDRALFDASRAHLGRLSRRTLAFDEGFVLPTFDAVEVRWRVGDEGTGFPVATVAGVHVGVGVTPEDHLELWAAPALREIACTVACVADDGKRTVVPRGAGGEALKSALTGAVDRAWHGLPRFLRAARKARRMNEEDPARALTGLHLPRSFRDATTVLLRPGEVSRFALALTLARAADEAEPLVARKFAWAAGRLLATTP